MSDESSQQLEKMIAQQLRDLPLRRAPASLQSKVRRELEQRAQLPWWRKSFAYWPLPARAALMLLCLAVANATINLLRVNRSPGGAQLTDVLHGTVGWAESAASCVQTVQSFITLLLRHLPAPWLYGGLLGIASLYATLLLLGTATYRTLSLSR